MVSGMSNKITPKETSYKVYFFGTVYKTVGYIIVSWGKAKA